VSMFARVCVFECVCVCVRLRVCARVCETRSEGGRKRR